MLVILFLSLIGGGTILGSLPTWSHVLITLLLLLLLQRLLLLLWITLKSLARLHLLWEDPSSIVGLTTALTTLLIALCVGVLAQPGLLLLLLELDNVLSLLCWLLWMPSSSRNLLAVAGVGGACLFSLPDIEFKPGQNVLETLLSIAEVLVLEQVLITHPQDQADVGQSANEGLLLIHAGPRVVLSQHNNFLLVHFREEFLHEFDRVEVAIVGDHLAHLLDVLGLQLLHLVLLHPHILLALVDVDGVEVILQFLVALVSHLLGRLELASEPLQRLVMVFMLLLGSSIGIFLNSLRREHYIDAVGGLGRIKQLLHLLHVDLDLNSRA